MVLALSEATFLSHPIQIRNLFAIILTTCSPSDPIGLWNKHKENMTEDILNKLLSYIDHTFLIN